MVEGKDTVEKNQEGEKGTSWKPRPIGKSKDPKARGSRVEKHAKELQRALDPEINKSSILYKQEPGRS